MKNIRDDSSISTTDPFGGSGTSDTVIQGLPIAHRAAEPAFDLQELLRLWDAPPAGDEAAVRAMRSMYADPVVLNGVSTGVAELVTRARSLAGALENVTREIIDVFRSGNKIAVAFRVHGVHVGPLATSAGVLAATGAVLTLRVIDILTLQDGLITEVVMVADELGALNTIGAVTLVPSRG